MKQIIYKLIYNPTINKVLIESNKFFSFILPNKIKISPAGILTIRNESGKKLKVKTNQTSYLTQILFWEGYKNYEYTDIFIKPIKKMSVFYDIGGNIGYYSLLAEMENPKIKVVVFEVASGPLFYLKENVKINNFKNITIEDIALSEKTDEITFYEIKNKKYTYLKYNLSGIGNTGSSPTNLNYKATQVKTKTLNKYIFYVNEENIDLIKMDTEGTEHLILKHSDVILKQMKSIIICETLFNTIESKLQSIFKKYGYEFYNHTEIGLKKVKYIVRNNDDGVRNCFFVHPSKFHLIEEFVK